VFLVVLGQAEREKDDKHHEQLRELEGTRQRPIQEIAAEDVGNRQKHQHCEYDTAQMGKEPIDDERNPFHLA
jgi:adenylate kinase